MCAIFGISIGRVRKIKEMESRLPPHDEKIKSAVLEASLFLMEGSMLWFM